MENSVEVAQNITTVTVLRLSISTSEYAVDPWTTQDWTVQVHL